MKSLAQIGYEAYAAQTGGKTWDGREMPRWADLPKHTCDAWEAAAGAIRIVAVADKAAR